MAKVEEIKTTMEDFKNQCERATELLGSLGGERSRWEEGARGFEALIASVVGDSLQAPCACFQRVFWF